MNAKHILLAACIGIALAACAQSPQPVEPADPNAGLPFDINDPNATFTATLIVEDRDGGHPAAALTFNGATYATDADGRIVVADVSIKNSTGARLSAPGLMARSVLLNYQSAGGEVGLRVVLEKPGVERQFAANEGAVLEHGPMRLELAGSSFRTSAGDAYTGVVKVGALGVDPLRSVVKVGMDGMSLRDDFDPARIPQGFGIATDNQSQVHFLLPESVFQVALTDDAGNPLTLDTGAPATYRFQLSSLTTRQEGDILPTYTFDETLQHWVQDGQCQVQSIAGTDNLECVGTTTHFSTWMVASGKDETRPACGNIRVRVGGSADYPATVTLSDGTTYDNRRPLTEIAEVFGRATESEAPSPVTTSPATTNAAKNCFLQADAYAYVKVKVILYRLVNGAPKKDVLFFTFGKTATSNYYDKNLSLVRMSVSNEDIKTSNIEAACGKCPATIVDIDPSGAKPVENPSPCDGVVCGPGATCAPASGICSCTDKNQQFTKGQGCAAPSCSMGYAWDPAAAACVDIKECSATPAPCDANATCRELAGSYACTCNAGYTGNGTSCTPMSACMPTNPCQHGGVCSQAGSGYTCACPATWTGNQCEIDVDECATGARTCTANAHCVDVDGGSLCACDAGYTGDGSTCTIIDNTCNNVDENMNGQFDESYVGQARLCVNGTTYACEQQTTICQSGEEICPASYYIPGSIESNCFDGYDDDCDSLSDANDPDCSGGCSYLGPDTNCNGVDDDCANGVDDGYVPVPCVEESGGACSMSVVTACNAGNVECAVGHSPPPASESSCFDSNDDDCDGQTDSADSDCSAPSCTPGNCTIGCPFYPTCVPSACVPGDCAISCPGHATGCTGGGGPTCGPAPACPMGCEGQNGCSFCEPGDCASYCDNYNTDCL